MLTTGIILQNGHARECWWEMSSLGKEETLLSITFELKARTPVF